MTKRWRPAATERGQATFSLLIVIVVVAIAVVLLQRTAWHAESINKKAGTIAETGGGAPHVSPPCSGANLYRGDTA